MYQPPIRQIRTIEKKHLFLFKNRIMARNIAQLRLQTRINNVLEAALK